MKKIKKNLLDIEFKLNQSYKREEQLNEQKAVDAIKTNPKYFFSYTTKHSKVKSWPFIKQIQRIDNRQEDNGRYASGTV